MAGLSMRSNQLGLKQPPKSSFFGCPRVLSAHAHRQQRSTFLLRVVSEKVLIANTKGGGHAFIGLHLAQQLLQKGHEVTILNDGDEGKQTKKAPYSQYGALKDAGVQIVWGDPAQPDVLPSLDFDVVIDNNGKTLEVCKPLIDAFKGKVQHYMFVSSAGAYNANSVEPMHVEGDPRKSSAGHVAVEQYLASEGLPYTIFQPLYIYGPHTGKDCEQWFIDRVIRDRPVPIPAPGMQLVTLTHVDDVASMIAAVPGNKAAIGQTYNICSDRQVTFDGMTRLTAKALGKEAQIHHYNPKDVGLGKGEGFPFRTVHFFASSDKAKRELGWQPKHSPVADIASLIEAYKQSGRDSAEIDFSVDDKILAASK